MRHDHPILLPPEPSLVRHSRQAAYWRMKRAIDLVGAACLAIVLAPLGAVIAALVAIDVGIPVTFWQQRPGALGRPFRMCKFRTMTDAHDGAGMRIPDEQRVTALGRILRRTRLDELPQLYNILRGEMSFVGPRPLLPADQPAQPSARLAVRPGLTGWAQVAGGRTISASDKAALDAWYIANASLALDLRIIIRTAGIVVSGDRVNPTAIRRAWVDLRRRGIRVDGPVADTGEPA